MGKKMLLLVVLVAVCLCGSALALDPMGPPVAGLTKGQWSVGLDYAFSETDLDFDGSFDFYVYLDYPIYDYYYVTDIEDKLTFEAVEMHKGYLNIGYGVTDNVEAFLRIGGARAETIKPNRDIYDGGMWIHEDGPVHDFDAGFAVGFGGKATLYEDGPLKMGVLGQASWTELDVRVKYQGMAATGPVYGQWEVPCEGELEFWEVQIAAGASYELSPGFTAYGGPFFYWLDGEYNFKMDDWGTYMGTIPGDGPMFIMGYLDIKGSYDVENDSEFGGYLGAQIEVTENTNCRAECILTGDAIGFGTGLTWLF